MMYVELRSPDNVIHKLEAIIGNGDFTVTRIVSGEVKTENKEAAEKGANDRGTLESTTIETS